MARFADIKVGQVVRLSKKNGGLPEVVIAIGKYVPCVPAEPHTVKWKGYTYNPTRWFTLDPKLAQRTVVTMNVVPDQPTTIKAFTSANIAAILPDREAVRWANTTRSSVTGNRIRKQAGTQRKEYEQVIRDIYAAIAGPPTGGGVYASYTTPVRILTDKPDFVERMALLWLNYVKAQGGEIIPGEDAESTIDAYMDAMAGLADTSEDGVRKAVSRAESYDPMTEESPEWLDPMRIDGKVVGLGS